MTAILVGSDFHFPRCGDPMTHPDFNEFSPPQVGELVVLSAELRSYYDPPLQGRFFRFKQIKFNHDAQLDEWYFEDPLYRQVVIVRFGFNLIRRATLSEKDAYSRRLDPAVQRLNQNLHSVFAPRRVVRGRPV